MSRGKFVGNIAPFGYDRVKIKNSKGYTLAINQDEALVVKEIFRLYTFENQTINSVAKQLNALNLNLGLQMNGLVLPLKRFFLILYILAKLFGIEENKKKETKNGHIVFLDLVIKII